MGPDARRAPVLRLVTSNDKGLRSSREPVRLGKVRTAQARIAADYYDRPTVRERVLDAVLQELNRR